MPRRTKYDTMFGGTPALVPENVKPKEEEKPVETASPKKVQAPVEEKKPAQNKEKAEEKSAPKARLSLTSAEIVKILKRTPGRGKTVSVYLDPDVCEVITEAAEKNDIPFSKIVNYLLRTELKL